MLIPRLGAAASLKYCISVCNPIIMSYQMKLQQQGVHLYAMHWNPTYDELLMPTYLCRAAAAMLSCNSIAAILRTNIPSMSQVLVLR